MNVRESKIFVVENDGGAQQSLTAVFDTVGYPVETFATAKEFLAAYTGSQPACLILAVRASEVSGVAVQEQLRAEGACLPIIVVSSDADVPVAVRAMKAGAVDFILKPFRDNDLLDRTRAALAIAWLNFEEERERALFETRLQRLTRREREILLHLLDGKANKVIADDLRISQKTVEVHRYHLMRKMDASSSIQLARAAGRFWRSLWSEPRASSINRAA